MEVLARRRAEGQGCGGTLAEALECVGIDRRRLGFGLSTVGNATGSDCYRLSEKYDLVFSYFFGSGGQKRGGIAIGPTRLPGRHFKTISELFGENRLRKVDNDGGNVD